MKEKWLRSPGQCECGSRQRSFEMEGAQEQGWVEPSGKCSELEARQRKKLVGLLAGRQDERKLQQTKTPISPGTRKPLANFLQGLGSRGRLENLVWSEAHWQVVVREEAQATVREEAHVAAQEAHVAV